MELYKNKIIFRIYLSSHFLNAKQCSPPGFTSSINIFTHHSLILLLLLKLVFLPWRTHSQRKIWTEYCKSRTCLLWSDFSFDLVQTFQPKLSLIFQIKCLNSLKYKEGKKYWYVTMYPNYSFVYSQNLAGCCSLNTKRWGFQICGHLFSLKDNEKKADSVEDKKAILSYLTSFGF